jgi:hypothetical protein
MSVGEGRQFFVLLDGMLTEMITSKQAAYHLNFSMRTIRQYADEGKLIAINVDGRLWITKASVEECLMRRDNATESVAS